MLVTTNSLVPSQISAAAAEVTLLQTPAQLLQDVKFLSALGAGGFGVVFKGTYQGGAAAIKLAAFKGDKTDWREGLVSPQLRHPHVVHTMCVRAAMMTPDFLEAVWSPTEPKPRAPLSASLLPNFTSDDGLGDPRKMAGVDERRGWQEVFSRVGAMPNTRVLMLVQELCDYGNLTRAIREGAFRPREAREGAKPVSQHLARRMLLRTAAEVCRGMIHLHEANVIHGDLKPANVLLSRSQADRRGFTVKIADFGLARVLEVNASRIESDSCGTAAYCSPEAFGGVFSRSSDVYAFGLILWEMLTGERPFEKLPAGRILMGVSFQGLRPKWPVEEWPELCELGAPCLVHEPGERPTFRQLEEALVGMEEALRAEAVSQRHLTESARLLSTSGDMSLASGSQPRMVAPSTALGDGNGSRSGMPARHAGSGVGGESLRRRYDAGSAAAPAAHSQPFDSLDALSPWTAVAAPASVAQ